MQITAFSFALYLQRAAVISNTSSSRHALSDYMQIGYDCNLFETLDRCALRFAMKFKENVQQQT